MQSGSGGLGLFFVLALFVFSALVSKTIEWKSPVGTIVFSPDLKRVGDWLSIPRLGRDSNGNQAAFEFHTLLGVNHDYGWKFKSWDQIQDVVSNQVVDAEPFLRAKLNESAIQQRIRGSSDVISVGVASCEGYPVEEERRAETRAKVIRRSVEPIAATTEGELYLLLLGQYYDASCSAKSPSQTLAQRSVIIIGVIQKDPDVDLEEAVYNAISSARTDDYLKRDLGRYLSDPDRSPLGTLEPERYSRFDLKM